MIIFIVKHRTDDKDACRVLSSKSQKAIRGKHLYECSKLTSWFRYGDYQIKIEYLIYFLGLRGGLTYHQANNVKYWDTKELKNCSNIDFLTNLIIERYGDDFDLIGALTEIQEKYGSYEFQVYRSMDLKIPFSMIKKHLTEDKINFDVAEFISQNDPRYNTKTYEKENQKNWGDC